MPEYLASLVARASLWILLAFSIASWALIVLKAVQATMAAAADRRYTRLHAASDSLDQLLQYDADASVEGPMTRVATALAVALANAGNGHRQNIAERTLDRQIRRERRATDRGLAVLASIGSTAPFVGLFGTVFGIIHALSAISHRASASIDVVAGPIGEALIATGVGIAVAIPAVLAYNFFIRRSKSLNANLDEFANDLLALVHANDTPLHLVRYADKAQRGNAADTKQGSYAS